MHFIRACAVSASFGSGAACQFTPSMVLSTDLAIAGVASPSPSHVDQASSCRIAGLRGSPSWNLIVRRIDQVIETDRTMLSTAADWTISSSR
jgi:hypothetical protein